MSQKLDLEKLLSIEGLPGVKDQNGEPLEPFEAPEIDDLVSNPDDPSEDLRNDYGTVRNGLNFQEQMLKLAVLKAYEMMVTSDNPRFYEAFNSLMGQMNANSKQRMELFKQMKEITQRAVGTAGGDGGQPKQIENKQETVFQGTAAELMKKIGSQLDQQARTSREKVINSTPDEEHPLDAVKNSPR
ncbi:terminase small subunit [Vibrio phage EniLVp02]